MVRNASTSVTATNAAAGSLLRWSRRHPVFTDAGWVVGLAVLTGADIVHRRTVSEVAWQAALWLPVIFRRRAPLAVFVAVGVVAAAQWAWHTPSGGDLAVLVVLYTVAAHRSRILAVAAAAAVEVGVVLAVLRFGETLWPRFLLLLTILTVAAASLGITQQARRSHLAALTDRAERLEREGQQQAALAAAAERTRIAREVHDIVAHSLSVIITLADGASLTEDYAQARVAMRQVGSTGREALADTRRVLDVLRTDADPTDLAPLPGVHSLETLLTSVRATGFHTSLAVSGSVFTFPEAAQLAIYRIVQEALTNILKHAREVTHAAVRLSYDYPVVTVDVTDDGNTSRDVVAHRRVDGAHGLVGIGERAALFHGTSTAGRLPGGGWRTSVTLRLPGLTPTDRPAEPIVIASFPAPVAQ